MVALPGSKKLGLNIEIPLFKRKSKGRRFCDKKTMYKPSTINRGNPKELVFPMEDYLGVFLGWISELLLVFPEEFLGWNSGLLLVVPVALDEEFLGNFVGVDSKMLTVVLVILEEFLGVLLGWISKLLVVLLVLTAPNPVDNGVVPTVTNQVLHGFLRA